MSIDTSDMTAQEARFHLARLGLSQVAFSRTIRVNPATARRWLAHTDSLDIPRAVQLMLRIMTPGQARYLLKEIGETPIDASAPNFRPRKRRKRKTTQP